MGLFSKKSKENVEQEAAAPVSPKKKTSEETWTDPLATVPNTPQGESAAPAVKRKVPSREQREYFQRIERERGSRLPRPSIAGMLEEAGLVNSDMIEEAIRRGGEEATAITKELVKSGQIREEDILDAIADNLGMEKVDISQVNVTEDLLAQMDKETAVKFRVFPVAYDADSLHVALADPMNVQVIDDLERIVRRKVYGMVAKEIEIDRAIKRFYEGNEMAEFYQAVTDEMHESEARLKESYNEVDIEEDANLPPVVKFVDLIFKQAVHDRASDIHIEPTRHQCVIRFRIDGVCHEIPSPPKKWQNAIISRLKVLSGMDLAEKRIPQDGRIKLNMTDRRLDVRVNLLPTIYGESIVMRLLDQSSVMLGLEDVGFLPDNIRLFRELIRQPTGVILMTGPTGSGKTTTLYSALSQLNTPETKIITIENPVEYMLDGVIQVQVNEELGLNFRTGLRSMLRQSPDVILVGEIRDMETAEIAVRAALTGHLVFSTLHTNDAPSAATRMTDMGVKPFLVASSVQAVIAQRLIRRLCAHCKRQEHFDPSGMEGVGATEEELANGVDICVPQGCDRCSSSGYKGRTAIHEIFVVTPQIRQLIMRGEPSSRLKRIAVRGGMRSLRMDGFRKVVLGHTSVEELDRITAAD
ncbi:MAG: ATPase, T2SS/T4P/T4SS family [Sumerlaeia bacterium]